MPDLIVILGPTAVGKTTLAVNFAIQNKAEIISADSRQVYCGMDIGTGKDLEEYTIGDNKVPFHLIDILPPGAAYNLFQFQEDFYNAHQAISARNKTTILCGGTGMYLSAALSETKLQQVPKNERLRQQLNDFSQEELTTHLLKIKPIQHNQTDLLDRERTIRAIEIALFEAAEHNQPQPSPIQSAIVFGIEMERKKLRQRIKSRLESRLNEGMIEEVELLLTNGITHEQLQYYGLEYKFISLFLENKITKEELFEQLLQAIRRFAKKQMTWYRRMEKRGTKINWMPAEMPLAEKVIFMESKIKNG